jgi:hypothetical protein
MQLSQSLAIKIGAWAAIVLGAGAVTLVELITQSFYVDIVVSALSGVILACIVKLARPQRARSFLQRPGSQLPTPTTGTSDQQKSIGQTLTTVIAPLLALIGLLIYAVFSQVYDRFYGALGVHTGDVGLGYTNTIASASGTVVTIVAIAAPIIATYFALTFWFWTREMTESERSQRSLAVSRHIASETSAVAVVSFLIVFAFYSNRALQYEVEAVKFVRSGAGVSVIRSGGPLVAFSLHAYRARIDTLNTSPNSANKKASSVANNRPGECSGGIGELRNKVIIFLGEANSTAIFYDYKCERAVYVPTASIVISVGP